MMSMRLPWDADAARYRSTLLEDVREASALEWLLLAVTLGAAGALTDWTAVASSWGGLLGDYADLYGVLAADGWRAMAPEWLRAVSEGLNRAMLAPFAEERMDGLLWTMAPVAALVVGWPSAGQRRRDAERTICAEPWPSRPPPRA